MTSNRAESLSEPHHQSVKGLRSASLGLRLSSAKETLTHLPSLLSLLLQLRQNLNLLFDHTPDADKECECAGIWGRCRVAFT
jgi:hypothetical protein